MFQVCNVTLEVLFWKPQEATYCAYCFFIVRYSARTMGSAKVRHSTYYKTMSALVINVLSQDETIVRQNRRTIDISMVRVGGRAVHFLKYAPVRGAHIPIAY